MNVALWIIQALLAALFIFGGGMKLVLPLDKLTGPVPMPGMFLRFIGVCELLGGLGLILPSLLRIRPGLTPLAAVGLVLWGAIRPEEWFLHERFGAPYDDYTRRVRRWL